MSAAGERDIQVPTVGPDTATRLRRWARKRSRQLLRVLLALTGLIVLTVAIAFLYRGVCLVGLPDVGDPFDVVALNARTIPDDRNAFMLFRQAEGKRTRMPFLSKAIQTAGPSVGWSKADPELREWVSANREALALFRKASEQADGWAHPLGRASSYNHESVNIDSFVWLALLEGTRLEEQGDVAGAWAWYRTVPRMRAQIMRCGTLFERLFASLNCKALEPAVTRWAADPRTSVSEIRRALDDVKACAPRAEWDASSLKVDYCLAKNELDRPDQILSSRDIEAGTIRIAGEDLPPNLVSVVHSVRRFLIREPERSRRVLRLTFANWLAHLETPEERQRKPAVRASYLGDGRKTSLFFYAAGPAAPASARALDPQDLAQWLMVAPDARWLLFQWPWPSIAIQERREHRSLMVLLAEELYRREHGRKPTSEQALVGTYLKSLPDDGSADLDDGTAMSVDDSRLSAPGSIFK